MKEAALYCNLRMASPSQSEIPAAPEQKTLEKQEKLLESLRALDSLLVAFSGGADSAYLAWAAHRRPGSRRPGDHGALGKLFRCTIASRRRRSRSQREFVTNSSRLMNFENPLYVANNADRCYYCKDELFDRMESVASERNFSAIAYGLTRTTRTISAPAIARPASIACSLRCSTPA